MSIDDNECRIVRETRSGAWKFTLFAGLGHDGNVILTYHPSPGAAQITFHFTAQEFVDFMRAANSLLQEHFLLVEAVKEDDDGVTAA